MAMTAPPSSMVKGANGDMIMNFGNNTIIICGKVDVNPVSIWHGGSPILAPLPLLLFQISMISIVSTLIDAFLRHLWQSSVVSQIFSGLVFGPSLLGHQQKLSQTLFPIKGHVMLETFATFGVMFFLFSIGVKMDVNMMIRPGKKAMIIGCSAFFVTLIASIAFAFALISTVPMDQRLVASLPMVAATQGLTGFPVIVVLLTELKILNTDIGRLALSSSMFCDLVGISITAIALSIFDKEGQVSVMSLLAILCDAGFFILIIYVFRPIATMIRARMVRNQTEDERYILIIFMMLFLASFLSEVIGQHFVLGPLVFGIVVHDGPPLGTAIATKIDSFADRLFYPTYCAISGLATNIYSITLKNFVIVCSVVAFSFMAKILAVMFPAAIFKIPLKDSFVLALILNARGIVELLLYNMWKEGGLLNDEEFALAVTSVVLVTALITPLIKLLYDPADRLMTEIGRTTIQQNFMKNSATTPELRMMVCIQRHETVPSILNLLEVSHATDQSPLAIITMVLVELVGRTAPLLITDEEMRSSLRSSAMTPTSTKVISMINEYYEQCDDEQVISMKSFASISYMESMHEDICRVAADEHANILILPFHKQYQVDDNTVNASTTTTLQIQNLNIRVLEKAPCSVAILIDRGISNGPVAVTANQLSSSSMLRVGVLFIGGPDDAESLAYGARMVQHENVELTVIRYLLFGCANTKERRSETNLIDEYRQMNAMNGRFSCVEEVVRDGEGLASSIKAIWDCFDIILVGRYHAESPLTEGLNEWSECPELGVIGDMLASPDYGITATVLVVQQQRLAGGSLLRRQTIPKDRTSHVGEPGRSMQQPNSSWTVSLDR